MFCHCTRTTTSRGESSACQAPRLRPRAPLAAVHAASLTSDFVAAAACELVGDRVVDGTTVAVAAVVVDDIVVNLLLPLAAQVSDRFAGLVRRPPPRCCCCHSRSSLSSIAHCRRVDESSAAAEVWLAVRSSLSSRLMMRHVNEAGSLALEAAGHELSRSRQGEGRGVNISIVSCENNKKQKKLSFTKQLSAKSLIRFFREKKKSFCFRTHKFTLGEVFMNFVAIKREIHGTPK